MDTLKKGIIVRNGVCVGFGDKTYSTCPIGTVLSYAGQTVPNGYLLADGTSYPTTEYPDLYAVIGNTYGGDTENFNVPNLVDKFIQGSTTSGTEKEAGLPNITGNVGYLKSVADTDLTKEWNGAFKWTTYSATSNTLSQTNSANTYDLEFDASKSNAIYGNSDTVQPPALTMVYIIKAFHTNEGVDSGVSDDVVDYIDGKINDATTNTKTTWSSSKINEELEDVRSELDVIIEGANKETPIDDTVASLTTVWSSKKISEDLAELETEINNKADKDDIYTKTETDNKITEKVSEIVSGAPEDFDTLKEMSDWLTEHEESAAAMNSAIHGKVDKETGKSLMTDTEIERLANVDNYDDTSVNAQIADVYNNRIGGKNLFKASDQKSTSKGITTEWKAGVLYVTGTAGNDEDIYAAGYPYIMAGAQMTIPEASRVTCEYTSYTEAATVQLHIMRGDAHHHPHITASANIDLLKGDRIGGICVKVKKGTTYDFTAKIMIRPEIIEDRTFTPYIPTNTELQEQINTLVSRIAVLEAATGTVAEE